MICRANITKAEITALKELTHRNNITITKADKGGAIVIIDAKDYSKEAEHQLSNKYAYKKLTRRLQHDTTQTRLVNDTIKRFKNDNLSAENIAKETEIQQPEMQKLYSPPKIHKARNPERPVVGSVNCRTKSISKYEDFNL